MRRLKVDVDLDSGYVILKMPVRDFKELSVAASLHCYDGADQARKKDDEFERNQDLAYHRGLLLFLKGVEQLIDMQVRPFIYEDPLPYTRCSKAVRRRDIEAEKKERLLLDKIIDEALAAERVQKEA